MIFSVALVVSCFKIVTNFNEVWWEVGPWAKKRNDYFLVFF